MPPWYSLSDGDEYSFFSVNSDNSVVKKISDVSAPAHPPRACDRDPAIRSADARRDGGRALLPGRRIPHRSVAAGRPRGDHARARRSCASGERRVSLRAIRRRSSCGAASGPMLRSRALPYGQTLTLGGVRVSFHPAGHVLGSAQVRVEGHDGVWVVSGDYKRAPDPTCAPFEPVRCDTFITESTFGLPIYRWDPTAVRHRRHHRVVEREPRRGTDVGALLLHDRQGAARPRRADAGHGSARLRARDDARA